MSGLRNCGGTKEMWRQRPPDSKGPIEKARGRFPGAGINSCDDEDMPVICPTAQEVFSEQEVFLGSGSHTNQARQKMPRALYSITSSASAASVGGISSPIDFAVLRLITNW